MKENRENKSVEELVVWEEISSFAPKTEASIVESIIDVMII
jgi:hypothetical protein